MNAFIILSLCVVAVFSQNADFEQQGLQLCVSSGASAMACSTAHNCIKGVWANKPRPAPGSQMPSEIGQCATAAGITIQQQEFIKNQMKTMPRPQFPGQ